MHKIQAGIMGEWYKHTHYFKIMRFFTRNWVYTAHFGLKFGL